MQSSSEDDTALLRPIDMPLLSPPIADWQRAALHEQSVKRRNTVVAAMLNERTASPVVAHYLRAAARSMEIEARQLNDTIVGCHLSPVDSFVALKDEQKELESQIWSLQTAVADNENRYGQISVEDRSTLMHIENMRVHLEAMRSLASFVENPPHLLHDPSYTSAVARSVFFCALNSSRMLKTMVTTQHSDLRLQCHQHLEQYAARIFFAQLGVATCKFTSTRNVSSYMADIDGIAALGMAEPPAFLSATATSSSPSPRAKHRPIHEMY